MEPQVKGIALQIVVIAAATFMLIAAAIGGGAFGGVSVSELQGGALSAQASYLAPAGPAFAIWSLIYLGLIAYTIWQALPSQREDARHRETRGWIALSMCLNGLWLITARFGTLWSTVVVIALLLVVLARVMVVLGRRPASGWVERTVVDGVNGLHFGWVTIASVANIAAWLTATAPESWADQAELWAVLVLVAVLVICVSSAWATGRIAPTLASAWGLAWLAVGRLTDSPLSNTTAVTAIGVAVLIVLTAIVAAARKRRERAPTRT